MTPQEFIDKHNSGEVGIYLCNDGKVRCVEERANEIKGDIVWAEDGIAAVFKKSETGKFLLSQTPEKK